MAPSISFPLSILFTTSFVTGELPDIWKMANVTPIFKKGQTCDPGNYRPISLTCVFCKIMETIIKDNIITYLLANNLITKHQHGFLAKHSTCSQLLECINDWSIALNVRNSVDIIYIDFNASNQSNINIFEKRHRRIFHIYNYLSTKKSQFVKKSYYFIFNVCNYSITSVIFAR